MDRGMGLDMRQMIGRGKNEENNKGLDLWTRKYSTKYMVSYKREERMWEVSKGNRKEN
jgi:hypothetical protein